MTLGKRIFFHAYLKTVRFNLGTSGSTQIHIQIGDNSLLDVDDFKGLVFVYEQSFNDASPQVNLFKEWINVSNNLNNQK